MQHDLYSLPPDLPVPRDDGAAAHLIGMKIPNLTLKSTQGVVNVSDFAVLYIYPRTGRPDRNMFPGWDQIPGARGCTPQSCAFRDTFSEFRALGLPIAGLSAQSLDDQKEFAIRNHMLFPILADPERLLGASLHLPTFSVAGHILYKRLTLVADRGNITKVFYPVFPPDKNAAEVLNYLKQARCRRTS